MTCLIDLGFFFSGGDDGSGGRRWGTEGLGSLLIELQYKMVCATDSGRDGSDRQTRGLTRPAHGRRYGTATPNSYRDFQQCLVYSSDHVK